MLQDFNFNIVRRPGLRHSNVDALSRNLVGEAMDDDDFSEEIQDLKTIQTRQRQEWLGFGRQGKHPCSMMNVALALTIGVVIMTIECIWWMFSLKKVIPPQMLVSKKGRKE